MQLFHKAINMNFLHQCQQLAGQYFGIQKLHSAQEDVFNLLVQNKFVLATLPTGSGKTLLYAIPSLIFKEGPVLVISPLISLMRDQMRRMQDAQIDCVLFTSEQTDEERLKSHQDLWSVHTKIIFMSPERFVLPSFLEKIGRLKPSMIVIDEAHCVVSWGHQFRPEYSELSTHFAQLQPPRILALTATASATTREEMIRKIFPVNTKVSQYISKPIRPHITVKSHRAFSFEEQKQYLIAVLQDTHSQKSIVYFSTRKQCEEFALLLKQKQLNTVVYHAGLAKDMRVRIEQYIYHTDKKIVVCATTAFGLGVDIPDVKLVVVYGFPNNIEDFLQMIGRAGRNGEASEGILIWTGSDPIKRTLQFKNDFPTKTELQNYCQKIAHYFPKQEGESRFIPFDVLTRSLFAKEKPHNATKKLEGVLSAFRVCHMTKDVILNEDYYSIKFLNKISLSQLINSLPDTPTKRGKVLAAVQQLLLPNLSQNNEVEFIFSAAKIIQLSLLPADMCETVFEYYASKGLINFSKLDFNQMKQGIILINGTQMLKFHINQYVKLRQHFYSSFMELTKFAEAPRCRLESSYKYFKVPEIHYGTYHCLQCDLCKIYKRTLCKNS